MLHIQSVSLKSYLDLEYRTNKLSTFKNVLEVLLNRRLSPGLILDSILLAKTHGYAVKFFPPWDINLDYFCYILLTVLLMSCG